MQTLMSKIAISYAPLPRDVPDMTSMVRTALIGFLVALLAAPASAQESAGPGFGGPNAVENQVEYDFGDKWDAWKQKLKDDLTSLDRQLESEREVAGQTEAAGMAYPAFVAAALDLSLIHI